MSEIKLTLGNEPAAPEPAAAMAAAAAPAEEKKEEEKKPVFTPEEQAQIDEFSKKIDITN